MTDRYLLPDDGELEALFVNNPHLDELEAYLNRFNPIRIMRMEGMELRHSNILAWLLDPLETHGLGDRFLKSFLSEALRGESAKGMPTALEITQADLQDIEVRREWQHIDIFLLSRRNNWAFIVENKFHAAQHKGQLSKYIDKVRSSFEPEEGKLDIRGVFLTLHDEEPAEPSYVSIGYDAVCDLLTRAMQTEGQSLGKEVQVFLSHYIEIIKEAAGMSEERERFERLARSLYRQHRKALDFIQEHGSATNFSLALDDAFGDAWEDRGIVEIGRLSICKLRSRGDRLRFLPLKWHGALGGDRYRWPGCKDWWAGYPVVCWIEMFNGDKSAEGTLRLFAEVGPLSDFEARKELIDAIKDKARLAGIKEVGFQRTAAKEGKKYSKFLKNNSISVKDVQDVEEISKAILILITKFQRVFDEIAPVLEPFVQYGEVDDA